MNIEPVLPHIHNDQFIQTIVSEKILTEENVRKILLQHNENALAVLSHLVQEREDRKQDLCRFWGDAIGKSYVDIEKTLFQHDIVQKLPAEFARKNKMIPLYQMGDVVTVATADPVNLFVIEEAERLIGHPLSPVFALPADIEDAIEVEYQSNMDLDTSLEQIGSTMGEEYETVTAEQLSTISGEESVIEFTRTLILLAIKERASDIHIEPGPDVARVRYRIDGTLHEKHTLDMSLLQPIVLRLKILANIDITEHRKPLDGGINFPLRNRKIDIRFSSIPTIYGEKIVLRILGGAKSKEIPDLTEIDFPKDIYINVRTILHAPNGIFFVTGPTGSGKTTTLYSALNYLNTPDLNIMTIEDPVEYKLSGLNQLQVNSKIGLTYASALRAYLRQDPDVILVGEVRDEETARIALQAALTGHLILASMHTNSAAQAVTRLIEMDVEPYLVAPSILGVLYQRLVRKICDRCKEQYTISPSEIKRFFLWDGKTEVRFSRGKGCDYCNHTGYYGRLSISELLVVNNEIRSIITQRNSITAIQNYLKQSHFKTIRYDGIKKVLRGMTTIEEIDRATFTEDEL